MNFLRSLEGVRVVNQKIAQLECTALKFHKPSEKKYKFYAENQFVNFH